MRILISACLLGRACRYDGQAKGIDALSVLQDRHTLFFVCPECDGGLQTPRAPSERCGDYVMNDRGEDVTAQYQKGAQIALETARKNGCDLAILKERSPSCGTGQIYDGTFTRTLKDGDGVTAQLLKENGITVIGESEAIARIQKGKL
jgi:uncharacterized protein YbbK (DUF523 family)